MSNWIQGAIRHPGSLRATAHRMGMLHGNGPLSERALVQLQHAHNPLTRKRARLAVTLKHLHHTLAKR